MNKNEEFAEIETSKGKEKFKRKYMTALLTMHPTLFRMRNQ